METNATPVSVLIEVLKTLQPNAVVYLEGGDGNTIPWSGQVTVVPECTLNATTPSDRPAAKLHI